MQLTNGLQFKVFKSLVYLIHCINLINGAKTHTISPLEILFPFKQYSLSLCENK